ncbi:hypothetical protein SUGI_0117900 [Cryptomeria japonica]|nr:hypothetical protein SUGI_0117900 [Cryptomeria japonica]
MDSFDTHKFCRSAGLICREDVAWPTEALSDIFNANAELGKVEKHIFFDKKELPESGEMILSDLSPSKYFISFLPSELAEVIAPFSTANVCQILKWLNIPSESNISRSTLGTLEMC